MSSGYELFHGWRKDFAEGFKFRPEHGHAVLRRRFFLEKVQGKMKKPSRSLSEERWTCE